MTEPNVVGGLAGGALIGAASVLLLALTGRIAGISGILGGLLTPAPAGDRAWRLAFLAGLGVGAALYTAIAGHLPMTMRAQGLGLVAAGFLVGVGTRVGGGCTSGHGVCGLARRSARSLVATATFIAAGMLTVFVMRQALP